MTLYEIAEGILECVDEDGEIIDEEKLSALQMEAQDKVENIALWIKDLKAEAEALKAEKMNLQKRQTAAENKAESLKRYLYGFLAGEKFKTPRVSISYRRSEQVSVKDADEIPEEYWKRPEPELMRQKIKDAIKKDGLIVPGVELVAVDNIQIR